MKRWAIIAAIANTLVGLVIVFAGGLLAWIAISVLNYKGEDADGPQQFGPAIFLGATSLLVLAPGILSFGMSAGCFYLYRRCSHTPIQRFGKIYLTVASLTPVLAGGLSFWISR